MGETRRIESTRSGWLSSRSKLKKRPTVGTWHARRRRRLLLGRTQDSGSCRCSKPLTRPRSESGLDVMDERYWPHDTESSRTKLRLWIIVVIQYNSLVKYEFLNIHTNTNRTRTPPSRPSLSFAFPPSQFFSLLLTPLLRLVTNLPI